MRLAVCALSAVLLSGCSWLGDHVRNATNVQNNVRFNNSSQYGGMAASQHNPCVVYSPRAPIPRGCDPASVTIGAASGGFPQQPNFGGGNYASGGYGSHASVAGQQAAHYQPRKRIRKPNLRGSLSAGFEKSFSGNILDYANVSGLDPIGIYNPQLYNEGRRVGSQAAGNITDTTWTANNQNVTGLGVLTPNQYEEALTPDISFDDVHSTPFRVAGGVEYIVSPKTTFFANAGYSAAEGKAGSVGTVNATLYRLTESQDYIPEDPGLNAMGDPNPPTGNFIENGGVSRSTSYLPNQEIARFSYDFTDMKRIDLELGARHYFNPIIKDQGFKTLTPFVGASLGASHFNGVSFDTSQSQLFYERAFESGGDVADFYEVTGPSTRVDLYDSQWVPSGQLNAGVEWQVTPKTALAFESGLRVEGARKYSNGEKGDKNIAVPFTVRGSYNF